MGRPGIMLYFDMLEPIRVLSDCDKGRLLVAMLEYGQRGTEPVFDGMLALAWGFVKPKLDRDFETYWQSVLRRRYATLCRERKKKGEPEITFEEWVKTVKIENRYTSSMMINDDQWYPTTTTAATTAATANTSTAISTAAAATTTPCAAAAAESGFKEIQDGGTDAVRPQGRWNGTEQEAPSDEGGSDAEESKVKVMGGELGRNVVFLSDTQVEALLDEMALETFDYYVDKLAAFIQKNGARVKNHYETILKWYREDGRTGGR